MSEKYSSKIPLVEPADQRIKIARLSTSLATRLFSTDSDGKDVVVKACHANYIYNYLNKQYDKAAMSYDTYSKHADRGDKMTDDERMTLTERIKTLPDWEFLLQKLGNLGQFRKNSVSDTLGWDNDVTRDVFKKLNKWGCIRPTSNGYVKFPAFNLLIKQLVGTSFNGNGKHDTPKPVAEILNFQEDDAEPF
jgi:hypothetical protein